ncbi:MAG: hypothetical protein UX02_C0001G0265 [Candidatus Moranbacteria bacterium GW2011_GWC1_45_18]|nr:MAG: hypothetical protein UT79_C0002G0132 [Candidatus Moranbacteria bacterium GW2011_GWC2_40_12]KKT32201.1 MAG: hypothetical protein UW19_C0028G0007 [Candidatus Moranbacteria bacterium GW2011_GWF2_44_10]KKU00817.1 MAG: hypothetical protein UX02_C0001G0265 [Candidatus Moranbacteria bacterium GW2011_GWC1_45_18]OGI36791.1 MAG: hypothetical protein A2407_00100 [Candidatus Moranbacteria bacterium RIFOXYC1_FULL_44_8]OGI40732.1 MAG: hypothetical protein A2374_05185 [Candidatus Moranbacteria bacteri
MPLISIFYLILVLVYLAIGAAIIFHMLYYRINRKVATVMFFIYSTGGIILLTSNFFLFRIVNWYNIFSDSGF